MASNKNQYRDFRQETIDYIKENLVDADPNYDGFTDFFKNIFSFNKNLDADLGNFDKYMGRICEINDITSAKLDEIIAEVHSVEGTYEAKFNGYFSNLTCCSSLLNRLFAEISEESFEMSFDKNLIYSFWNDSIALEEMRIKFEYLSDEELSNLDVSDFTDEELAVYMQEVMNRMNTDNADHLLALIEEAGKSNPAIQDVYIGVLLSLIVSERVSLEKAEEYSRLIAEFILQTCSYSDRAKLFEFPIFVAPGMTIKYSFYIELKGTSPDAIIKLQTSILEQTGRIKIALNDSNFIKPDWNKNGWDSLSYGFDVGGVTVEVDLIKILAGTLKVTLTFPYEENEYFKMTQKVIIEVKNEPNQFKLPERAAVPVMVPVATAVAMHVTWAEQAWQDISNWCSQAVEDIGEWLEANWGWVVLGVAIVAAIIVCVFFPGAIPAAIAAISSLAQAILPVAQAVT